MYAGVNQMFKWLKSLFTKKDKRKADFFDIPLQNKPKRFKSIFPLKGDIPGVSKELQDKAWDEYKKTKPKRPRLYKQATVVTKGELPKTTERKKTVAKNGLYANIHAKQERIEKQKAAGGKVETMRKPGTKGAPTAKAFKESAKTAKAKK